ncbi:MAG: hypothetical protein ACTHMI_04960 [Mucilaginibacter sp.]
MKKLLVLLIVPLLFLSCGKSGDVIPNVAVNVSFGRYDPSYSALNAPNGHVILDNVGIAGIILYKTADGNIMAYDRCSSYQPQKKCAVNIDDSGFTATDPCSGSKFDLGNYGTPVKAPATRALKSYVVSVSQFTIYVSN